MDPCQSSGFKHDTYGSNTGTDFKYVLDSDVRPIPSGDFASKDEAELAVQGKKQQTNRNFGFIGILSFSCLLMLTWEAMFTSVILSSN
ncbi:MAG: hypothetical protein Q9204_004844 [Flavoplaca sp. TL-2023a]